MRKGRRRSWIRRRNGPLRERSRGGGESGERKKELGRLGAGGGDLQAAAEMWPSPASRDEKGANSEKHCMTTGTGRKHMDQLANFVVHSRRVRVMSKDGGESSPKARTSCQRLNPAFVCWLMGWPWWWTKAERISFAGAEMELWLFRQRRLLWRWIDARAGLELKGER